jgi:hypothetical protein
MRRAHALHLYVTLTLIAGLLITGLFGLPDAQRADTHNLAPTSESIMAPPLRGPETYTSQGLKPDAIEAMSRPAAPASTTGLKAVAIVGDVEGHTDDFISDMNKAVNALENYGASVATFYYGQRSFSWDDIVTAANGAHFLLYMGHGVYYGGECANPTEVGGFALGYGPIVTPDDIRNDLAGRMAPHAVVILSHACFSAGNTSCDPTGWPNEAEAERRVRMYAAPFVDIGLQAYYANNYYNSTTAYIYELLAPMDTRSSVGNIFKSVDPYSASEFRDLTYPAAGAYDLWLSGSTGDFSDAFVGIPTYIFQDETIPELGSLPTAIDLTFDSGTETFTSGNDTIGIENVGSADALNWEVTQEGDWFTTVPSQGKAPDDPNLTIAPNVSELLKLDEGRYTGVLTVTITDPPDTENAVQHVDLSVTVEGPRLGDLTDAVKFVYFPESETLIPGFHSLQPQNVGTANTLTWQVDLSSDWLTVTPPTGTTPDTFSVTPDGITGQTAVTRTAVVTVTVTDPPGTFDPVQVITVNLNSQEGEPGRVYLPIVVR